jgi:hypothetical protein
LQSLPFEQRRTLQLVHAVSFSAQNSGNNKWRGTLKTLNGQYLDATITDPVFVEKLNAGYQPKNNCLVTVSLSMPYQPRPDWEGEKPCWKLIAGVIEL